ncbi:MAG: hypothetical protein ACOCVG_01370 [Verrucomicrobiota bacterium]
MRSPLGEYPLGRAAIDAFLWPSDYWKIRRRFYEQIGRFPRILRPRSLNDHVQHSKLFDRKPIYAQLLDKIAVRPYVAERVGEDALPKLLWHGIDIQGARQLDLPARFVIKSNIGSGRNMLVPDASQLDWERAANAAWHWKS